MLKHAYNLGVQAAFEKLSVNPLSLAVFGGGAGALGGSLMSKGKTRGARIKDTLLGAALGAGGAYGGARLGKALGKAPIQRGAKAMETSVKDFLQNVYTKRTHQQNMRDLGLGIRPPTLEQFEKNILRRATRGRAVRETIPTTLGLGAGIAGAAALPQVTNT